MTQKQLTERIVEFEGRWFGEWCEVELDKDGQPSKVKSGGCLVEDSYVDNGDFKMRIHLQADGKFNGTAEDEHGPANIEGMLDSDKIKFTKQYDLEKANPNAFRDGIIYEGEKIRGAGLNFQGLWCPSWAYDHAPKSELHYPFVLLEKKAC